MPYEKLLVIAPRLHEPVENNIGIGAGIIGGEYDGLYMMRGNVRWGIAKQISKDADVPQTRREVSQSSFVRIRF